MSIAGVTEVMDRLGMPKESFLALGLLPLVHVAWADGAVQMAERSVLLDFAKEKGWLSAGGEELLTQWLTSPPSRADVLDASKAIARLAREPRGLGASVPLRTPADILLIGHEIAGVSGGLFGFKPAISAEESAALQDIADAMQIEPGARWETIVKSLSESPVESQAPGSEAHFILGSVPEMLSNPIDLFVRTWQRFGDISRLKLGPMVAFLAVHPDHVKHVLVDNSRNYVRDPLFLELKRVVGEGLLMNDGEPWRRQRKLMQPAFHQKKIAGMASRMAAAGRELIEELSASAEAGRPIDMAQVMGSQTLRIAGRLLFNTETASDTAAFIDAIPVIMAYVAVRGRSIIKVPQALPTATNRRFREAMDTLDRVVYKTLELRRKGAGESEDLLSLMMEARYEDTGLGMTDEQLRNEVLTLFLAGSETSATALTWTWVQLSKNPAVMRELRAEVDRVLGGREPTLDDLPNLVYTTAVLEESMRLRPPAWLISRTAVAEDSLSGRRITKNSIVFISPYLVHRHPAFWENPEGFDPTRFLPGKDAERHPFAYVPFGAGPRKCIGLSFAMMEMKILLAMMVQAFNFHLVPGSEPQLEASLTLRPRDGSWMTVHRRA
jgi:cytochrome P450